MKQRDISCSYKPLISRGVKILCLSFICGFIDVSWLQTSITFISTSLKFNLTFVNTENNIFYRSRRSLSLRFV